MPESELLLCSLSLPVLPSFISPAFGDGRETALRWAVKAACKEVHQNGNSPSELDPVAASRER